MKKLLPLYALLFIGMGNAWALATDNDQPIEIHADRFNGDEVKQTAVYTGNVVVDQGSIRFTGNTLTLSITPKGYRHIVLVGAPSTFKQKRDNPNPKIDEWIHARSSKIIYDEETDKVTLSGKAELKRTENGQQKDMTSGETITYDMRNALSEVSGAVVNGTHRRVTTIIAPRRNNDDNKGTTQQRQPLQNSSNISKSKTEGK